MTDPTPPSREEVQRWRSEMGLHDPGRIDIERTLDTLLAVMDACTPERLELLERKAWSSGFAADLRTALGLDESGTGE